MKHGWEGRKAIFGSSKSTHQMVTAFPALQNGSACISPCSIRVSSVAELNGYDLGEGFHHFPMFGTFPRWELWITFIMPGSKRQMWFTLTKMSLVDHGCAKAGVEHSSREEAPINWREHRLKNGPDLVSLKI
jgi:hypothetical protein